METNELLKKLKNINPDSDYSRKSRMIVLSAEGNSSPTLPFSFYGEQRRTIKQITVGVLRSGWAMALTAAFILLAIGSFSVLKFLSPATTAVVDITGLKAEAQAIDAQIEFTNVVYNSSVGIENKTSTSSIMLPETKPQKAAAKQTKNTASPSATSSAENASAQPTIDSALDILSQ